VKIRGDKLKQFMGEKGAGPDTLAKALARKGLDERRAESAVRNWMRGSDHPRCKPEDVKVLARELGCSVADLVRFTSQVKYHRGGVRKAGLLADLIRGKDVETARNFLEFTPKLAAVNVKKALEAAVADSGAYDVDQADLVIVESRVDQGPRIKRFQPKDRGRAHPIIKPMAHITVGVQLKEQA
jgi:large subunit ribosomal protein L22